MNSTNRASCLICLILFLVIVILSIIDIAINVGDTVVDAVTVGIGGIVTSIVDLIATIVLGVLQIQLMLFFFKKCCLMDPDSIKGKRNILYGLLGFKVIVTLLGFFPYFDIAETILEIPTELVDVYFVLNCLIECFSSQ